MKKPYTKPAILVRVKCEARAVQCAKSSEACQPVGPIIS
jgi:hypothetical protein